MIALQMQSKAALPLFLLRRLIPAGHGLRSKCAFAPLSSLRTWYNDYMKCKEAWTWRLIVSRSAMMIQY